MKLKNIEQRIDEKLIIFLIMVTPFIDLLNGFFEFVLNSGISPGVIIRFVILIIIMAMYIHLDNKNLLKAIGIIIIFITQMLLLSFSRKLDFFNEISFVAKIYYNIFLIFIASTIFSRKDWNYNIYIDAFSKVCIIVNISLIITRIVGIGVNSYGDAGGYKGLYMGTNDLTAVLIMTFPFMLFQLVKVKKNIFLGTLVILSVLNILMIGTKTSIVFLILIGLFFVYELVLKDTSIKSLIILLLLGIIFIFIFNKYIRNIFESTIIMRQKYFINNNDSFISYLLSQRNTTFVNSIVFWKSKILYILLGTGFTDGSGYIESFLPGHGMIEMDLLDILYFYGIVFFSIVAIPLIRILGKGIKVIFKGRKFEYRLIGLIYVCVFIISLLGGHVLLSPLAGTYFAIIYGMLKNI